MILFKTPNQLSRCQYYIKLASFNSGFVNYQAGIPLVTGKLKYKKIIKS